MWKPAQRPGALRRALLAYPGALVTAVALLGTPLQAQQVTGYLVGYLDGDETSLGLLGAIVQPRGMGLRPVASLEGFVLGYDQGGGENATVVAVSPGVGAQYSGPDGAVMGRVSYQFVGDEDTGASFFTGGESGPGVTVQGQYWGGIPMVEALASYNTASNFLWSQAQAYLPVVRLDPGSIDLGAEVIWQGDMDDRDQQSQHFGPLLRWATGSGVYTFVSGGLKNNQGPAENTWYGRAAFVVVR